ncbi:MAG: isocitrate/isopropylmalate family dehydrogenase [Opitutaceae bacterium]
MAGKGIANSFGQIWSGAMMLERLGQPEAAPTILQALETVVQHGPRTRDLAGTANTIEVDRGIATAVRGD